ncbi:MAG: alpha/beta hydrolase [Lachnospiraceae bacterium]|nr:alpha/beta hydrolase [Lachnospiraceae bacterium]
MAGKEGILSKILAKNDTNQGLMNIVRAVHGLLESDDIEKVRSAQENMGSLLTARKNRRFREEELNGIHGEWTLVDRPHEKKRIVLFCHGGGYSTGSCIYARSVTTKLAEALALDVLSFDYRLAPEFPYPAACEDAMKVWNSLMLRGYGADQIIVAGDSAGGNLALSLLLKLKSEQRMLPGALILMSPWTDMTASGKSYEQKADLDPVLDADYMERMTVNYAQELDRNDPFLSPLFGDFTGFPPTYIQVGSNEILFSDSAMLFEKMQKAGVRSKIDIYEGMWHVFQMTSFKTAYEAVDDAAQFLYDTILK